jgi:uncharacterized protein
VIVYLDTSAMLRLYVNEPGARQVRAAVAAATGVYSHLIAYTEMCVAFSKAARMGRISTALDCAVTTGCIWRQQNLCM